VRRLIFHLDGKSSVRLVARIKIEEWSHLRIEFSNIKKHINLMRYKLPFT
jgi:hypothetical protein